MTSPVEYGLGATCLVLGLLCGVQTLRVANAQRGEAVAVGSLNKAQAQAEHEATMAADSYRAKETGWRRNLTEAQHAHELTKSNADRSAVSLRSDNDRLRVQLSDYAASGAAPGDPGASASDHAATLGALLADSLQAGADCARAAEDHASGVRALLDAWPVDGAEQ